MAYQKSRNPDGRPTDYGEAKTRVNMSLTPTCIDTLDASASELGYSRSELIERFSRSPDCLRFFKAMMRSQTKAKPEGKVSNKVGQLELIS